MIETSELGADRLRAEGDDFYDLLMKAHEGLSFEQSAALNARLILLLANQVGDLEALREVLSVARAKMTEGK